jgi:pilus assembly protein CpaB
MGLRRILILLLAVGAAGATAMYARSWVEGQQPAAVAAPPPPEVEFAEVLVADVPLPAGTFVKPAHLRWQRWPTDDVPESYLLKEERSEEEMVGAVVRRGLTLGEPITDGSVVKPGERGFLAAVLSPGMRAVSIPITPTSANSGLIFPGDRIDLILTQTLTSGDDTARRVSETVLRNMRVIAMGDQTGDEPKQGQSHEGARTATLEVTPVQAEEVTLLTELGKLSLSLRSLASSDEVAQAEERAREPFTWDSEVSQVLGKSNRITSRLLVLRGSEAENVQQGSE